MEKCIFCRIINNEIPAAKVWEDENFFAFLTIQPINPGHTLVLPKKHTNYFFDLEDKDIGSIMVACKPIAEAIAKAFPPKTGRIGVMIAGMGVPHAHVHLIPMQAERDLDFNKAKDVSFDKLNINSEKIKKYLIL